MRYRQAVCVAVAMSLYCLACAAGADPWSFAAGVVTMFLFVLALHMVTK